MPPGPGGELIYLAGAVSRDTAHGPVTTTVRPAGGITPRPGSPPSWSTTGRQTLNAPGQLAANVSYCSEMTWIPLLATLVGAVIAMGSALLVERRKTQRETTVEWGRTRRQLYARFLSDHAQAGSDLRNIAATPGLDVSERYRQTRAAYAHCYTSRHETALAGRARGRPGPDLLMRRRAARRTDVGHDWLEPRAVVHVPAGDREREGASPAVAGEVDSGAQSAAGASECFTGPGPPLPPSWPRNEAPGLRPRYDLSPQSR